MVIARRAEGGEVVGVAAGRRHAAVPTQVVIDPEAVHEGVDDHLTARWAWTAAAS